MIDEGKTIREGGVAVDRLACISAHDSSQAECPIYLHLKCATCGATAFVEVGIWKGGRGELNRSMNDLFVVIATGQHDDALGWFIWEGQWRCGKHHVVLADRAP